jgi:hypothetical protein
MDSMQVSKFCGMSTKDLFALLTSAPSKELFAAMHRLAIRYCLTKDDPNAYDFFIKVSLQPTDQISPEYQRDFEILKETASYARIVEIRAYERKQEEEARIALGDKFLIQLLTMIDRKGPFDVQKFRQQIVGLEDGKRVVNKAFKEGYIVLTRSTLLPDYICLTHKARRILDYVSTQNR